MSKITITEIITDCGVNRKTFYYHFEDIYALPKWMLEEEAIASLLIEEFTGKNEHDPDTVVEYFSRILKSSLPSVLLNAGGASFLEYSSPTISRI